MLIANIRMLLKSDEDHHKIEVRNFIHEINQISNTEDTSSKLALISDSLNALERSHLLGLILLYAESSREGLLGEFLSALSADQMGSELIIRGEHTADKGLTTKPPIRRLRPSAWKLEGSKTRISTETSSRVSNFSDEAHALLRDGLSLAIMGNSSAYDRLKDFCRGFLKTGITADENSMSRFCNTLNARESAFFLGSIVLYGNNINTNRFSNMFSVLADNEARDLTQVLADKVGETKLKVNQAIRG